MDPAARRRTRRLALLATLAAGILIAAALYMALWTPPNLLLATARGATGRQVVTWVAPDGPAWVAGVRPGDAIVVGGMRGAANRLVVHIGAERRVMALPSTTVTQAELLMVGLGLCLLMLGAVVLVKSEVSQAAMAFWRMSMLASATMALYPAEIRAAAWAVAIGFVSLKLSGPALLELTLAFPGSEARVSHRRLLWLPALVVLPVYAVCWWQPVPLFPLVQISGFIILAGYMLAACVRIVFVSCRPLNTLQRAQLQFLALGVVCGFAPFLLLSLAPLIVIGRPIVPAEITILALVLLPLSVGVAIVRTEFLGITSLIHHGSLRLVVSMALLAGIATVAWLDAAATSQGRYSASVIAAGVCAAAALSFTPVRDWLVRRAAHFFLRDVYDTGGTLLELSVDLSGAAPREIGPLVVERLSRVLDLSFALLLTEHEQWYRRHPRSMVPSALQEAAAQHARRLFVAPPSAEAFLERVQRLPALFLPVWDGPHLLAILCLGPKRSGDRYTPQDRVLLGSLGRHLAVQFCNHRLRAQLDEQIATLRDLVAERTMLSAHVRSAAERERRRLAGVLHDDAIQIAGEVVRSLRGLLEEHDLPVASYEKIAVTASLRVCESTGGKGTDRAGGERRRGVD